MALSRAEIQRNSDARRGIQSKSFKLKIEEIEALREWAEQSGKSQTEILREALALWAQAQGL